MAADIVIVCADNIVPVGVMSPDHVVTPAPAGHLFAWRIWLNR
jgi:acyl CoA:acetate/3-ketoacid CoA transferase alpha subunit